MEITDIFIVNKMDLPGADKKFSELIQMLEMNMNYKYDSDQLNDDFAKIRNWTPEIVKTNSKTGENFDKLLGVLDKHREYLEKSGVISNYMKTRIKSETLQILKYKLTRKVEQLIDSNAKVDELISKVMEKQLDPYSMADSIIELLGIEN